MKRIGFCSGPLDVKLVRTFFDTKRIKVTITNLLEIKVDFATAAFARELLLEFRGRDCWLDKELEASGRFEHLD